MGSAYTTHLVNRSPIYLLLCTIVVLAGGIAQVLPPKQIAWLIVLGAGLSPVLIMAYITERNFYAFLYGASYGLIATWIVQSALFNKTGEVLSFFLTPASVFAGTFAIFYIFRKKLLRVV